MHTLPPSLKRLHTRNESIFKPRGYSLNLLASAKKLSSDERSAQLTQSDHPNVGDKILVNANSGNPASTDDTKMKAMQCDQSLFQVSHGPLPHGIKKAEALDHETSVGVTEVSLRPRIWTYKDQDELCPIDTKTKTNEDLLALRPTKSFDEFCDGNKSIWTRQSPVSDRGHEYQGNVELEIMRDVPAGGIVTLPRATPASSSPSRKGPASSSPVADDLTSPMAKLQVRTESLGRDATSAEFVIISTKNILHTPEAVHQLYGDIFTPHKPRPHLRFCHSETYDLPTKLLLPNFTE